MSTCSISTCVHVFISCSSTVPPSRYHPNTTANNRHLTRKFLILILCQHPFILFHHPRRLAFDGYLISHQNRYEKAATTAAAAAANGHKKVLVRVSYHYDRRRFFVLLMFMMPPVILPPPAPPSRRPPPAATCSSVNIIVWCPKTINFCFQCCTCARHCVPSTSWWWR